VGVRLSSLPHRDMEYKLASTATGASKIGIIAVLRFIV
jgi:hypothetical protein